jgi:hypothetical protein
VNPIATVFNRLVKLRAVVICNAVSGQLKGLA